MVNGCCAGKKNCKNKNTDNQTLIKNVSIVRDTSYHTPVDLDYKIINAEIKDSILNVEVLYNGGCGQHLWDLVWTGAYMKSLPMKVPLTIEHKSINETCNNQMNEKLYYNIGSLNPKRGEKLILLLKGYDGKLEYIIR